MKLKTVDVNGTTYAEIKDGRPLYEDDDGKEIAFDAEHTARKISELNAEAKKHREAKEAAEKTLKGFEGIEDAEAARKALQTVKNLDDKKLIDAGEVEKVKAETIKALEAKYEPVSKRAEELEAQLRQEKIGGSFARSKFIAEKVAVPVPMVEKTFGDQFTVEDGKIVAKDANGNPIYSRAQPGEPAGFDEALEIIVSQSPYKDQILREKPKTGGDAGGGDGGSGGRQIKRSEFDQMSQSQRAEAVREGAKVVE